QIGSAWPLETAVRGRAHKGVSGWIPLNRSRRHIADPNVDGFCFSPCQVEGFPMDTHDDISH
ncbi:hypothetical protein LEMLEM_LOCUS7608, partial [Lemmus lemmus]